MTLVEIAGARLRVAFPSRAAFEWAVPNKMPDGSPIPSRYYIVSSNVGGEDSLDLSNAHDHRSPVLWVRCVSRRPDPQQAAREATSWAEDARDALRGLREPLGSGLVELEHLVSSQPYRDEGLPDSTWLATEQWLADFRA